MPKTIWEYNIEFENRGKVVKLQQSGLGFQDAQVRIRKRYPHAKNFKLLKRMPYPHKIG